MFSFSAFPVPLLALLLSTPVFSASSPTTPNDPFHDIAIHIPKQPEPPICCLQPLPSQEPSEEDVLVSFEEWKAKKLAEVHKDLPPVDHRTKSTDVTVELPVTSSNHPVTSIVEQSEPIPPTSPHFRIPILDRFNYASMDCSARVHDAHRSAKSASSILSSKKDRYMLSPCAEKNQYVVVELCDDIRIDTVQLANYEFFSGVFKDFTVRVAKTYPTDLEGWTVAGSYRAKNVRGVQSFHTPNSLGDFYRFIRVDFNSHYGNEYYCPLSLLRVYGLTHLEQWKWDEWEAESRRRKAAAEGAVSAPAEVVVEPPKPVHASDADPEKSNATVTPETVISAVERTSIASDEHVKTNPSSPMTYLPQTLPSPEAVRSRDFSSHPSASSQHPAPSEVDADQAAHSHSELPQAPAQPHPSGISQNLSTSNNDINDPTRNSSQDPVYKDSSSSSATSSPTMASPQTSLSESAPSSEHSGGSISSPTTSTGASPLNNSSTTNHTSSVHIARSASHIHSPSASIHSPHSLTTVIPIPLPPPASTGGESIYRTIMNRLTALEANTTLYARYVEEQTTGVREVLRRLSEDVGRLEG
ncbi:SUN domain-containing Suco/Slp1-like protein, partial [Abortiporus biennis]